MTRKIEQWYQLRTGLATGELSQPNIENQFYRKLLLVLNDRTARVGDILGAYRDALCAAPFEAESAGLPGAGVGEISSKLFSAWGLEKAFGSQDIKLSERDSLRFPISDGILDLGDIYREVRRRYIHAYKIDPVLSKRLREDRYMEFRGAGQRDAVRMALTCEDGGTFLFNLPTGVGKTLITEALVAFSPAHVLTIVIVPTISLALDQACRMQATLRRMSEDHGGGYCWCGGLTDHERADILDRIRSGTQRVVFCSPESALTSLRIPILEAARVGGLGNVVIDEAHLVDQWGAEFRPDFQGLSALLTTARRLARARGSSVRCSLLSATFSSKTTEVLRTLFSFEDMSFVAVHGSFLRPEIEYSVREVPKESHLDVTLEAISILPKPLIAYATTIQEADSIFDAVRERLQLARVARFTGRTEDANRKEILVNWVEDALDVVVATSAFGVGIDKPNVRSVLHASVPENLDRFYQEVGRAGRDGLAAASLVVFCEKQLRVASELNEQKLIGLTKGRERWGQLWDQGVPVEGGKRRIELQVIPNHLVWHGAENQKWNWRTITLMQRAGAIDVEVASPKHGVSSISDSPGSERGHVTQLQRNVKSDAVVLVVGAIRDEHKSLGFWTAVVGPQRRCEIQEQKKAHQALRTWLLNPNTESLCAALRDYYSIEGMQPELVCAGCPACRLDQTSHVSMPTVGSVAHTVGLETPTEWGKPGFSRSQQLAVYYDSIRFRDSARFIDESIHWIARILETRIVTGIRTTESLLDRIADKLPRGLRRYWIALSLGDTFLVDSFWRELVLVPPGYQSLPRIGLSNTPRILVAPREIPSPWHPNRLWWQDNASSIDINIFLNSLD